MNNPKHVIVIGAGFAGLSAASVLAKEGYQVTVVEKKRPTRWPCPRLGKRWF